MAMSMTSWVQGSRFRVETPKTCCACRYKVSSSGTVHQVAFHTPAEAVGWCLLVQSLLMTAAWPSVLEEHAQTALQCVPAASGVPWSLGNSLCQALASAFGHLCHLCLPTSATFL